MQSLAHVSPSNSQRLLALSLLPRQASADAILSGLKKAQKKAQGGPKHKRKVKGEKDAEQVEQAEPSGS